MFITFPCSKCWCEMASNQHFIGKPISCSCCGSFTVVPATSQNCPKPPGSSSSCSRRAPRPDGRSGVGGDQDKRPSQGAKATSDQSSQQSSRTHSSGGSVTLKCVRCSLPIRVALPPRADRFRCVECGHAYSVQLADAASIVYVVVGDVVESSTRSRECPAHVKRAFEDLEMPPTEDGDIVRAGYRRLIAQYHPDKVAHLGVELHRVAEAKTKRLIAAFKVIEEHLTGSG